MNNLISKKAQSIRSVIRYLQKFKNAIIVIYLDDKIIDSPLFSSHIRDIAFLHKAGLKVVIIPGAKKRIDEVLQTENIEWSYNDNIRITSDDAIPLIKMAAFDVSNIVMTSLAASNITAVIGNWVKARGKGIINGFDFGNAGEIERLELDSLNKILDDGFIPIFPCIGWSSVGHPYNISSLSLAQQVAISLNADKLFFLMDSESIDKNNFSIPEHFALTEEGSVPAMNLEELDEFLALNSCEKLSKQKNFIISVLKKSREALEKGVTRVHLVDVNVDGVLPCEIFSDLGSGTMIYTSNYGKIREASPTDIPAILRVMRPFVESGKILPRNENDIISSLNDYIVYEIDEGIHACGALHFYEDGQAEIAAIAVEESFANMGIGPKLVKFLIERAKNQNTKTVFILTTQASDWFEKLGFALDTVDSLPEKRKLKWNPQRNSKVFRFNFK